MQTLEKKEGAEGVEEEEGETEEKDEDEEEQEDEVFDEDDLEEVSLNPLPHSAVEKIVRKGENACNKQFILFSQCFPTYVTLIF